MARAADGIRGETQEQLRRAIWLDGEIRSGALPAVRDLMAKFEVSRRTAL